MDGVTITKPTTWTVIAEEASMDGCLTASPSAQVEGTIAISLGDDLGGCSYGYYPAERLRAWCAAVIEMIDGEA